MNASLMQGEILVEVSIGSLLVVLTNGEILKLPHIPSHTIGLDMAMTALEQPEVKSVVLTLTR